MILQPLTNTVQLVRFKQWNIPRIIRYWGTIAEAKKLTKKLYPHFCCPNIKTIERPEQMPEGTYHSYNGNSQQLEFCSLPNWQILEI